MEAMTPEELLETPDLIAVGVEGDEVRRQMHGTRTTFARVFEIHVDAPPQALPPRTDAGEFRIIGRPSSLQSLVNVARATRALAGDVPVTVFSMADVVALHTSVRNACEMLKEAGVAAIVQLPMDLVELPELVAADAREAGLPVLTLSIETLDRNRLIEMCRLASGLQASVGGFKAFAPLPRSIEPSQPTTGYDDVKLVALARVVATNIDSIQVDWALYGPKLAQVALTVGANDIDNIAAADPGILGTRRSPLEEIKGNIKAAALEPIERDALFTRRQP